MSAPTRSITTSSKECLSFALSSFYKTEILDSIHEYPSALEP